MTVIIAETRHIDLTTGETTAGDTIATTDEAFLTETGEPADISTWATLTFPARPAFNTQQVEQQYKKYQHAKHELDWDAETQEAEELIEALLTALQISIKY